MSNLAGSRPPSGKPGPPAGPPRTRVGDASPVMAVMAIAYLAVLPFGQLLVFPVGGAMATLADGVLALLLLAGLVDAGGNGLRWYGGRFQIALALFLLFALWAVLSGTWGFHSSYAVVKGTAYAVLALGAYCIAFSDLDWRRATDAWLLGTGVALLVVLVGVAFGPEGLRTRVLYQGGGVLGLPLPRVQGPFLHPNLFGSYLVVSGILLWSGWDDLVTRARWAAWGLAAGIGIALFLTASTAWLGAGVALVGWGRWMAASRRALAWGVRLGGAALAAVTLAGLLFAIEVAVGGVTVVTSGIRPAIWRSAFEAVREAPLLGVGAAPYLAEVMDPLQPGLGAQLWDAHSLYLSVVGQFGMVGGLLLGGAVAFVLGDVTRLPRSRIRSALLVAFLVAGIGGIADASEDFRHLWALVGLAGLVCVTTPFRRVRGDPTWAEPFEPVRSPDPAPPEKPR